MINLDQNVSEIMGFQIARVSGPEESTPGFKVQFDAGGRGSDLRVERITRNVLDRLSK